MKSIYKKILSVGLLSAFFELALIQRAHAGIFGDVIGSIGSWGILKASMGILGGFSADGVISCHSAVFVQGRGDICIYPVVVTVFGLVDNVGIYLTTRSDCFP